MACSLSQRRSLWWFTFFISSLVFIGYFSTPLTAQDQPAFYPTAVTGEAPSRIPHALYGVSYQPTSLPALDLAAVARAQASLPSQLCSPNELGYDCDRARERYLLDQIDGSLNRTGMALTIPLARSMSVVLTDHRVEKGDATTVIYLYAGYLPEIQRHHVIVGYYEGGDHLLIHAQTGEITVIPYAPLLSPDHQRLVSAGASFDSLITVQIWKTYNTHLNLEADLTVSNTQGKYIKELQWLAAAILQFDIAASGGDTLLTLLLERTNIGWQGYQGDKAIKPAALYPPAVLRENPFNVFGVDNLSIGKRVYRDREYRFTAVPDFLVGAQYLLMENNKTRNPEENYVHFALSRPAVVYIAIDDQALHLPGWMEGWIPTPDFLLTDDSVNLRLYKKEFDMGDVTLGGNWAPPAAGVRSHYLVAIIGQER